MRAERTAAAAAPAPSDETDRVADRRADRRAIALIAVLTLISLAVEISTRLAEIARLGLAVSAVEVWVLETTSHVVIFVLACGFPFLLNRAPSLSLTEWPRSLGVVSAGFVCFAAAHVVAMYALRLTLFPVFAGAPYALDMLRTDVLAYEFRKDILVYLTLLVVFVLNRLVEHARLDAAEALRTARTDHRLTLKSGGGMVMVNAADVLFAKAAGNYVEVHTAQRMHFCRLTLTQLEAMLSAAGASHARVHKSYLVNLDQIASITPTGEGDAVVTLRGGQSAPASRRYRDRLPSATSPP